MQSIYLWLGCEFDDETAAVQAAEIGKAILAARPLRLAVNASKMKGTPGGQLQLHPTAYLHTEK